LVNESRRKVVNLRIPGPIPVPADILEEMSRPMINHRGPEYKDLLLSATDRLKRVFETEGDVWIITGSGTAAMEAAVVNTLSPGDKVINATVGVFGNRFTDIASAYGAEVSTLEFPFGEVIDLDVLRETLKAEPDVKAVTVTHNETSTGVTNDLESIIRVVRERSDALLLVDAISSLGCVPLPVDEWDCDVVCTASQKGLMVPPGLSFVSLNERAWQAREMARMPRYYFDLPAAQRYLERAQTPWTPNVPLFYGLDVALDMILEEGMDAVFRRHARLGDLTRRSVADLGLELLADEAHASNTVTAVKAPEGVDAGRLSELLRTEHSVVVAGGQGKLSGKIFRIGHMGWVSEEDIREAVRAIETVLPRVGFRPPRDSRAGREMVS
jgi:aspartate aminotransferase-like enzyme